MNFYLIHPNILNGHTYEMEEHLRKVAHKYPIF